MTIEEIDRELVKLKAMISPLMRQQECLVAKRRRLVARQWIEANGVTRDDVELSEFSDGRPYFGTFRLFKDWLIEQQKSRPLRRFLEWNGGLYFTAEALVNGCCNSSATLDDLP